MFRMANKSQMVRVLSVAITAISMMLFGISGAYAAPLLTISVDQINPAGNNTPVNNCQNLTFQVTLTNSGADPAVNVNITNTMPAGFTLVSATPSLTGQTVPADNLPHTWDITYSASCTAVSGDNSTEVTFEGPAGTTYPNLTKLRPFTIFPGAITLTKVATHVNGSAITESSEPKAAIGDTVRWKITVKSSGLGSVSNVEVTETLGSGLVFTDAGTSPRLFDKNTHPALANIASNGTVDILIDTRVTGCNGLTNDVSAVWGCGAGYCLAAVTAQSSVNLQIKSPLLSFTPPDVNFTPGYCSSSAIVTGITLPIKNDGDGQATDVQLKVDFGSSITVNAVTAPAGASYDTATKTFKNIGNIAPGATVNLVYDLKYTPPASWCSGSATASGTLFWEPIYYDICNVLYAPPLRFSNYSVSLDPAKPQPTINITKSCTVDGSPMGLITQLKETSQAVVCTIKVDYSFPATCTASSSFSVTDTYPSQWVAGTISPVPSGYNNSGNPITWTIPAASLTGTGSITYTQNFTIPAMDSTICPACGTQWTNTVNITGTDCCACTISANNTVSTTVDCPSPQLGISSSRAISGSGIEVCDISSSIDFISTYTFSGTGWNSVPWANNVRFTEDKANSLELVEESLVVTANPGACTPTFTVTNNAPPGNLVINITGNGTCPVNIGENTVLTVQYQLRPTTSSQPQCGASNSFLDFSQLEILNTGSVGFGLYCPAGGGIVVKDADQVTVKGSEMTVDIQWDTPTPIVGPCGEYDATITVTKTSDKPAYDAVLFLENLNYDVLTLTSTSSLPAGSIAPFPTQTAVVNGYVWNFEDLFNGPAGQQAIIKVHVQGRCLSDPTLKVYFGHNDRCDNGMTDNNYTTRTCKSNDSVSGMIRNPTLTVEKFPEVVYVKGAVGEPGYQPAEWTITVINSGAGSAFNVEVIETLGADLKYLSSSWSNSTGVTTYPEKMPDNITPLNGASFVIKELTPGEKRFLTFKADIYGCENTTNTVEARVRCLNIAPTGCSSDSASSVIISPETDLVVTTSFVNPGNSCDIKYVTMTARNAGKMPIREIILNETLPTGLQYIPNTSQYQITPSGGSASGWLGAGNTEPQISGNLYKWAYNNASLPDDLVKATSPLGKLRVLNPGDIVEVRFSAAVGCTFAPGQIKFNAEYDECGSIGRKATSDSLFNVIPNKPIVTVTKTPASQDITCGGNALWTITISNSAAGTAGQPVPAQYLWIKDTWGDAYTDATVTITPVGSAPALTGFNSYKDDTNKQLTWELYNMPANTTYQYNVTATYGNCSGSLGNRIDAEVRCLSPLATPDNNPLVKDPGCDIPPGITSSANSVQVLPQLQTTLVTNTLNACSENVPIQIRLANTSALATLYNLDTDILLPAGVLLNATPNITVNGSAPTDTPEITMVGGRQRLRFYNGNTTAPNLPNIAPSGNILIGFNVDAQCLTAGDFSVTPTYLDCCNGSHSPGTSNLSTTWQYPQLSVNVINTGGPYECGAEVTWTVSVTNNGPVAAEMVRMSDVVGSGLSFLNGDAAPNNLDFYKTATGDTLFDWNAGTRTLTWEIGNLAAGTTQTYTLKTSMGAGASCTNPSNRRNTVSATWHCVPGSSADGNPTTNEGTCTSNAVSNSSDAAVDPNASATASITGNIDYCDKTKDVTLTITNPGTSSTLFNLTAEITLPANLKFASPTSFSATATNPVVWVFSDPADMGPHAYSDNPAGLTTYTFPVAYSVPKNTDVVLTFKVSSSCFSGGNITAAIRYDDCCNNHYGPVTTVQNVLPDNPVLDIAVTKNPPGVPNKGDNVDYTITVTNNSTARATYTQISAHLGKWLKFVSASTPVIVGGGTSSDVKCDDDGADACGACAVDFTEGTLYWDIKDFEGGAKWTTIVRLKFDPPVYGNDCNNDYTKLDVYTKFDCPDNIATWTFDGDACNNETGPGCALLQSNTLADSLTYCASLGNFVWYDTNGNGIQDDGATGIGNVTVELYYPGADGAIGGSGADADVLVTSMTTNTTAPIGEYLFNNLVPGNYYVKFIPPAGYLISQKDAGGNDATDSDAIQSPADVNYGTSIVTTLSPSENDLTWDAGMYRLEFGDLPDVYGTTLANNGARHVRQSGGGGIRLGGSNPDTETNGVPSVNADGDDTTGSDDENGITFLTPIMPSPTVGPANTFQIQAVVGSAAGRLSIWIDFNGDGDFNDIGEQIATDMVLAAGTHLLTFNAPVSSVPFATTLYSRFRITADLANQYEGGTPSPTGLAYSGEVEDYALMSLGNVVWIDNGAGTGGVPDNGIQDGSEAGVAGVVVELYRDVNGNNIAEPGGADGASVGTTTTDATGHYLFTGLAPGDYFVRIPASEFAVGKPLYAHFSTTDVANATGNTDPDTDADNENADENGVDNTNPSVNGINSIPVTLALGTEPAGGADGDNDANSNLTLDFGFLKYDYGDLPQDVSHTYGTTLSGNPLHSTNGGGRHVIDGSTYLGAGVDAENDGQPDVNAVGDDSTVAPGTDDEDGIVFLTSIQPGQEFKIEVTASMNGYLNAWIDFNGDGDFNDTGEHIRTDADGALTLSGGKQTLTFTAPSSPNPFPTTLYSRFRFTSGSGQATTPTGYAPNGEVEDYALMSLGNVVWFDVNDNGIMDTGENGIGNVKVDLYSETSPGVYAYFGTTTTDSTAGNEGRYLFTGLPPGNYKVKIPNNNFTGSGALVGYKSTSDQAGFDNPNNNNNETADENGIDDASYLTNGITTGTITLALGTEPDGGANGIDGDSDPNSNLTVDFGFYTPVNIGNLVWHDANNNGSVDTADPLEFGINGVTVYLYKDRDNDGIAEPGGDDGAFIATTTTDTNGLYNFGDLAPGKYFIVIPAPLATYPTSSTLTVTTDSGLGNVNNDDNGIQTTSGGQVISPIYTLISHDEILDSDGDGNDGDLTVDFGFYHPLSLGDLVWEDTNGNGIQDSGESGISGVTVRLFMGDGITQARNVAGNLVPSQTTDANGNYLFTDLPPGDYVVQVVRPSGYYLTRGKGGFENPSDPDNNDNTDSNGYNNSGNIESYPITLKSGDEPTDGGNSNLTVDFGFYRVPTIGDFVWNDLNMNGVQDTGEPGIFNVEVKLYNSSGIEMASTTTDVNGFYSIDTAAIALPPGDYYLTFTPPSTFGWQFTNKDGGSPNDDAKDSDADKTTGSTDPFSLTSDQSKLTLDAGLYSPDFGDLPDSYGTTGSSAARHTIDSIGAGAITYLGAGVDSEADGQPSAIANGDDTNGTTPDDEDGIVFLTPIMPGQPYRIQVTSTVGVLNAWIDFNGNGIFDTGERIISNMSLGAGTHTLNLTAPASPTPFASTLYSRFRFTATTGQGGDSPTGLAYSGEVEDYALMSLGDLVWNDNSLGGGTGNNGIQDGTEPGIAGVIVELLNSSGTVIATTTTDANGRYLFTGLNPGNYSVRIPASNFNGSGVLVAYRSTTDQAGFNTPNNDRNENQDENGIDDTNYITNGISSGTVTLAFGTEPTNDGDSDANSNRTVDFGFYAPMNLGNLVWHDANGNGLRDAGETGIDGVELRLFREGDNPASATPVAITTTSGGGVYNFNNLIPGRYFVYIPTPPALYPASSTVTDTADDDKDNDDNGSQASVGGAVTSPVISLASGTESTSDGDGNNGNLTVDFGFYAPVSIGNLVWADLNNNGIADVYETGIDGVRVELYREGQIPGDPGVTPVAATDTSGGGFYKFGNLSPGRYFVYIPTPPPDHLASSSAIVTDTNDNGEDHDDNGIQNVAGAPTRSPIITLTSRGEPDTAVDGDDVTGDMTVDFGFYHCITIGNFVWADSNVNGIQDGGEVGIPGVTVRLFDKDGNPVFDGHGNLVNPTTTDADGYYQFEGIAPGQYYVQFDKPTGYSPSPANQGSDDTKDSDADPTSGKTPILTLTSTGDHTIWDAGFWAPMSLGDYVWYDKNGNGIQDAGETGISGVTVKLFATSDDGATLTPATDVNGNSVADVTTDASGHYLFANLPGGDYVVEIIPPSGYALTKGGADPDNDVNTDSNGYIVSNRVLSPPITLFLGREPSDDGDSDISSNLTVDFGFYKPMSLGNFVWADSNGNGIQDTGEPGIAGVSVQIFATSDDGVTLTPATDISGNPVSATTTDANGLYGFTNLPPGDYVVQITPPDGYFLTSGGNDPDDNSNSDSNGYLKDDKVFSLPITLSSDDEPTTDGDTNANSNLTVDFGFYKPVSLGNFVWFDTDKNGIQNSGEPGLSGAIVQLFSTADNGTTLIPATDINGNVVASITTGSDGLYNFTNLRPGNYVVQVTPPAGYVTTIGGNDPDDDNNTDSNGYLNGGVIQSHPVMLEFGKEPVNDGDTDADSNLSVDFGFVKQYAATLGDYVWYDINKNGIQDASEPGIAGVTVKLLDAAGNILKTMTTDGSGHYLFNDLEPGTYSVQFIKPAGYDITLKSQGSDTARDSDADIATGRSPQITLGENEHNPKIDAGMYIPNTLPASLGDYVWYDANANGIQDSSEIGVAGVTVNLYNAAGVVISTTTTNGAGYYQFTGLAPGNYSVEFVKPGGYTFTAKTQGGDSAFDSDADTTTGKTATVILAAGEHNPKIDAGLLIPSVNAASLGDYVWYDTNRNCVQDVGETGVSGVTVNLLNSAGNIIKTTATDSSGYYLFANLTPGTYSVEFVKPKPDYVFSPKSQGTQNGLDSDADTTTGRTAQVTLAGGENNPRIDAGMFIPGTLPSSIGNRVWYDTDKDGIQDAGESGISGVTVTLKTSSGQIVATTTTDGSGNYLFSGLAAGDYVVTFEPPSGYHLSPMSQGSDRAKDSDAGITGSTGIITLGKGEHNPNIDAGMYSDSPPASLGDYVWYDTNKNGIQDAGETGVAGVTVRLLNAAGDVIATTSTDSSGYYHFTGLAPGAYSVEFVKPTGYAFSPKDQGSGALQDIFDSDADTNTGRTAQITLSAGENDLSTDAGLYIPGGLPASLGDYVWYDDNKNGIQDTGEKGVAGVTVTLRNAAGDIIATTQTDGSGYYLFDGLVPGDYLVGFTPLSGYHFSPQTQGSDTAKDSNPDTATGLTAVVHLSSGEHNPTIDAGLYADVPPASLGDTVWYDTNKNGIQDSGESGVSGVTVTLYDKTGTGIIAATQTDVNGYYEFAGLIPGDYTVGFGLPGGYKFSPQSQGGDSAKDSNADTVTGRTAIVHLNSGEHNPTIDAGIYAQNPIRLGDLVWLDNNNDGQPSPGEGIAGVTLNLYDGSGRLIGTTVTDMNGKYEFPNLPPGDYRVVVDTDTLPDGVTPIADADGVLDSRTDALNQTADNPNLDFGYMKGGVAASLGDIVWYDADADGIQDAGEAGVPGVVVKLYNAAGNPIATTTTDSTGYYRFDNLAPGSYSVEFVRPDGYSFSPKTQGSDTAKDSNADTTTGKTAMITLTAGEHNPTIDAGLFMPSSNSASLGDVVWYDTNHNGIQDAGEPGIAGITVNLLNAAGAVISTTVTDGTGYYQFTGLAPGSYSAEFVRPSDTYIFSPQSQGDNKAADSDANTSNGRTSLITLAAGEHNPKIDAGLYIPNMIPASLGNYVWYDSNHNGIQEQGELGIAGVTVHLLDASGRTVATTVTDGMGFYQFTGLIPGQYSVEFVRPDTYIFSPKAMGYGDLKDAFDSDADANTGKTGIITLSGGENNPKIDAGLYIPDADFATISDKIWYDVNQDGIQDPGEPGIPGVTVRLYDENGKLIATVRTDSTGYYIFSGLPKGEYIVEVEPPEGYLFSPEDAGNDDVDSDVNPSSGRTVVTILAAGERNIKVDAGLYSRTQLASLGNYVWYDSNRNGIQDADETGISGITVNLYDKTGTTIIATTVTDANGHYSFNGLIPGDYLVGFRLPDGYTFSPQSQGADTGADSNANVNTGLTPVITLKARENNPSIDAGVYVPNPIRLGDLVFWDKNNDGKPSSGEGIANVTVNLYDGSGNLIATTRTDADGHYEFPNLPPGDYRITVDTGTLPSGVKPLSDPDGVLNSSTDVKNQTTDNPNLDFGYHIPATPGGGGTPGGTSCSISNFIWVDNNHNGIQDAGEPGVPGVRVNLYAPDGSFLATTVTDENGYYIFDNLMPGTYIVEFELPPGYEFTLPNQGSNDTADSDADTITGRTSPITLSPGEHNTTVDAGLIPDDKITIGDLVWVDKNGDGVPSPGEGIPGVTVILLDGDGNVIATTVTDDKGHYHFTDLEPGDYKVVVDTDTLPDGVIPLKDPDGVLDSKTDLPNLNDDNPNVDFGYTPKLNDKPDLTGTTKSVADINGGLLEAGDTLLYAIVIYNSGDKPAQEVVYTDAPSPYTTLIPGSISTTQGTISEINGQIRVSIGDIPAKASVIIRYQVKVNAGVSAGTIISNQGVLTGKNIPDTPTDFPDTPAPDDATTVVVGKPKADVNIGASKIASVVGGGDLRPGGQITYQITIGNSGTSAAKDVSFSDKVPFHTTLVPGSISTTQGIVLGGSDVNVSVGTLRPGQTVNITFTVTVDSDADEGTVISNQGVVKYDGDKTKPTDDTITPIPDDTPDSDKPDIVAYKTIQDVNGGTIERGDILEYTVRIINPNKTGLENIVFYDNPAGFSVFSPMDAYYARLIPNTVSNTHGQVIAGNSADDRTVRVDVGDLNTNEIAEIRFQVAVSEYASDGVLIMNQGTVTVNGKFAKFTDDPYTLTQDDPTQVTVIHVNNGLGIRGIKTVSGTKPNLRWEIHWYNDNNDAVSVHIEDPLAIGLTYISGSADFGWFRYDEINRKIVWDGYIPAGKELGIWFETTAAEEVQHLENQAYLWWDKNKNGDWKDDTGNPISSILAVWEDTPAGECRLGLGDYVWIRDQLQCDDNGSVKPGWGSSRDSFITDTGINGVKINLYRDTDHNNKFTPGKDEFVASVVSKNGPDGRPGYYRFDNLCDGDYIVQIDAANFLCPGGILSGYLPLGALTDPDNNVNSDNNGYAVPGFGVLSDAVTLKSGTEPVNDGDSSADTNLSADFGFIQEVPCKSCCSEISTTLKP